MTKKITKLSIGGNSIELGSMGGMPDYKNGIELPDVGQIFVAPEDGFVSVQAIQYNDVEVYSAVLIDILNDKDEIVLSFGNRCFTGYHNKYNSSNIFLPIPKGTRLRIRVTQNQNVSSTDIFGYPAKSHKKFFPLLKD